MAKKKAQPVVMKQPESFRIIITIENISIGHQSHITGTGAHKDKRNKRARTRSAAKRKALKDESE